MMSSDSTHPGYDASSGASAGAEPSAARRFARTPKGPVRTLCDEIGFTWDARLEREDIFVAFVRELVASVDDMRNVQSVTAPFTGKLPSDGSAEVLALAWAMLAPMPTAERLVAAEAVHDASHRLNPDDAYPTDHLIDMLSSCASAIRFGLETERYGLGSRHAAGAAEHIWKHRYGVSIFDSETGAWGDQWACRRFMSAVLSLLPPPALSKASPQKAGNEGEVPGGVG